MDGHEGASALYERMAELAAQGRDFALATVVRTQGSTPQAIGARMVVPIDADLRPAGTLGGGCVEGDAIEVARRVGRDGGRVILRHELNEQLAWNTGLVCGGTMWILAERGDDALVCGDRNVLAHALQAARGGEGFAFVTMFRREGRHGLTFAGRVGVASDGRLIGTLGGAALDERARDLGLDRLRAGTPRSLVVDAACELLAEPIVRRPRLVVAGGGHVGRAIARQARLLDFDVVVVEDRPEFADPARFDGAQVIHAPIVETLAGFGCTGQDWVVVATRGHKLDADCVLAAARSEARYIGLLGSRRKTELVAGLLRSEGVPAERIAAVHAPVGLDLGGRSPAEIALAILAEITRIRYGGSGAPMRVRSLDQAGDAPEPESPVVRT